MPQSHDRMIFSLSVWLIIESSKRTEMLFFCRENLGSKSTAVAE